MTNRTDNLDRADTTNNIGNPSDGGAAWSQLSGTWGISSNTAYESAGSAGNVVCVLESSVSNVEVKATTSGTLTSAGLNARCADNLNYLLWIWNANNLQMFKNVAGSFTQLGSSIAYTWVSGDVFKFAVAGTNDLTGYVNGVTKLTVNDAAGASNTKHGLRTSGDSGVRFDDFSITVIAADPIGSANLTSSAGRFIGWTA